MCGVCMSVLVSMCVLVCICMCVGVCVSARMPVCICVCGMCKPVWVRVCICTCVCLCLCVTARTAVCICVCVCGMCKSVWVHVCIRMCTCLLWAEHDLCPGKLAGRWSPYLQGAGSFEPGPGKISTIISFSELLPHCSSQAPSSPPRTFSEGCHPPPHLPAPASTLHSGRS